MAIFGLFAKKAAKSGKKAGSKPKKAKVKPKLAKKAIKPKPSHKNPIKIAKKAGKTPASKPATKAVAHAHPLINKMPDQLAFELVKKAGIPLAPFVFVKNEKELSIGLKKIGFPCVLKVSGKSILHKTELSGVKINIQNEPSAIAAFKELVKIKGCEKVLVQKHLSGIELIVAGKSDPSFGYVVSVSLGGIYVEVLKDVAFRIAPITGVDAEAMVRELKGFEILNGMHGQKPINFPALYELLVKASRFLVSQKLKELDLNPVFCSAEGCWIADVRIVK